MLLHYRANRTSTSFRRSLTWFVRSVAGGCRSSNVTEDAAETGWQNGNGQIRRRKAQSRAFMAMLPGRCAELARGHGLFPERAIAAGDSCLTGRSLHGGGSGRVQGDHPLRRLAGSNRK